MDETGHRHNGVAGYAWLARTDDASLYRVELSRGGWVAGSRRGGERLAVAYTLVDNCILLGMDPQPYLEDVLTKLACGWPMRRLSELTPHRWLAEHLPERQKAEPPAGAADPGEAPLSAIRRARAIDVESGTPRGRAETCPT